MLSIKTLILFYSITVLLNTTNDGHFIWNIHTAPVLLQNENVPVLDREEAIDWIGKSTEELLSAFGEPVRRDVSAYDYIWWVYTDHRNYVYQFGINEQQIETVYVIDANKDKESYADLNEKYDFQMEVAYEQDQSDYIIRLTADDQKKRPLVKIGDDQFFQFYFDSFTGELIAYRILAGQTLLTQRPYEIEYRGSLPEQPTLSRDDWKKVEKGMEQQIFDVTNVLRSQYEVPALEWNELARDVAYMHSKDMGINEYFSHTNLNGDGLKERLEAKEVLYMNAAENIASGYIDALSAMEGWLNSESHREALLNEQYTHLGVGVYELNYTQNFIQKPVVQ